ncbi:MAG: YfhO family protein, partial [Bacteroidota bacterium]
AKLRLYQDFLENMLYDPSGLPNENALDLSGTRYIVLPQPLPGTTVAFQDDQNRQLVLERDNARPRSVLIGNVTQLEPGEPTYAAVRSPSFDPARDAILNESVETTFTAVDSTSVARVELAEYGPREMVWTVETDATRLLVTSEVYYPPGWTATVDGTETDILRVNHLFRGVVVPAGAEQVVMRFDPQSHSRGLWISWIASLLAYGFVFGGRQLLARRAKTANEPENVA